MKRIQKSDLELSEESLCSMIETELLHGKVYRYPWSVRTDMLALYSPGVS